MIIKGKRYNSCPEGSIYEQYAYTSHLGAYPNSSDMNELSEMPKPAYTNWRLEYDN